MTRVQTVAAGPAPLAPDRWSPNGDFAGDRLNVGKNGRVHRSPPQSAFVTERGHLVFSFPYWRFGLKVD
jgi:hypothetical protein